MVKKKTQTNSHAKTTKKTATKKVIKNAPIKVQKKESRTGIYIGLAVVVIAVIVVLIITLSGNEPKATGNELEFSGKIVAFINNEPVYEQELLREISQLPQELQVVMDAKTTLKQLIDKKLLLMEAENAGTNVDNDINTVLALNDLTMDELKTNLESQGFTYEEFEAQIKISVFLNNTLFSNVGVSDEEAVNYYNNNPSFFIVPEQVRARHILVSTSEMSEEEALTLINDIKAQVDANNSVFCDLVIEYSDDPGSLESCGEYPAFGRDSNFVQEYKDTSFSNAVGESNIAKTTFGYHLIQTLEKTPESVLEFEVIKSQLKDNLGFEKQKEVFTLYMEQLRNSVEITNCLETPDAEMCTDKEDIPTTVNGDELATFAQCLTENGVKMYGAYWCSHCENQKNTFGDAWQYITYVECAEENDPNAQTQVCVDASIQGYPTWMIDGQLHTGEKTFEELSALTGCVL